MRTGFGFSAWGKPLALSLAALMLAGCSQAEPPTAQAPTPTPTSSPSVTTSADDRTARLPGRPAKVGQCHRLRASELVESTATLRVIACGKAHTAQTIHVGTLDLIRAGHRLSTNSRAASQQMARTCSRQAARFLGGTLEQRRLSRLEVVWFGPGVRRSALGDRQFRCDVVGFSTGEKLRTLRTKLSPAVLTRQANEFALCGTAAPGAQDHQRVTCDQPHSWRAVATLDIPGGPAYPGSERARASRDGDCQDLARAEADFALRFTYGWEWPSKQQWRAGQRYGFCWVPQA